MTGIPSGGNSHYQNHPFDGDNSKFKPEPGFDDLDFEGDFDEVKSSDKQIESGEHIVSIRELSPEEKQSEISKIKFQERTPSSGDQTEMLSDIGKAQELIGKTTDDTTKASGELERLVREYKLEKCPFDEAMVKATMKNPFKENKKEYVANEKRVKQIDVKLVKIDKSLAADKKFLQSHVIIHENHIIHLNPDDPNHAKYFNKDNKEIGFIINDNIFFHSDLKKKFEDDPSIQLIYKNNPLDTRKIKHLSTNKYQKKLQTANTTFNRYQNFVTLKQNLTQERTTLIERQEFLFYVMQQQLLLKQRANSDSQSTKNLASKDNLSDILQSILNLSAHTILKNQPDSKNEKIEEKIEEFLKEAKKSNARGFASLISFLHQFTRNQQRIKEEKDTKEHQRIVKEHNNKADEQYFREKYLRDKDFNKKQTDTT